MTHTCATCGGSHPDIEFRHVANGNMICEACETMILSEVGRDHAANALETERRQLKVPTSGNPVVNIVNQNLPEGLHAAISIACAYIQSAAGEEFSGDTRTMIRRAERICIRAMNSYESTLKTDDEKDPS